MKEETLLFQYCKEASECLSKNCNGRHMKIVHFMIKHETWYMARLVINKNIEDQSPVRNEL